MHYLRFLAGALLLIAVFAIAADVTRSMSAHGVVLTSFLGHWERLSPTSLKNFEGFVVRTGGPAFWAYGMKRVLALPAVLIFVAAGAIFGYLGRRKRRVNIYSN